jgi:hypothetical protein
MPDVAKVRVPSKAKEWRCVPLGRQPGNAARHGVGKPLRDLLDRREFGKAEVIALHLDQQRGVMDHSMRNSLPSFR